MRRNLLCIPAASLLIAGCSTSKKATDSEFIEELHRYEGQFVPSNYDPDIPPERSGLSSPHPENVPDGHSPATPETSEFVPGFRVQLFSSMNIDEANTAKSEAEMSFPEQWFYIVYDPPAYKVRAGNFLTRFQAEQFAKKLADGGFRDAWTVPSKVLKNPPPRNLEPQNNGQNE